MEYKRYDDKYIVRLNKGEEVVKSVEHLAKKENIRLGKVSGIGAVNKVEIGLFETKSKEYNSKVFNEDLEIVTLEGNISEMDNETYIHLHIAVGNKDMEVYGGHLNSAVVSATAEIIVDVIDGEVDRKFNDEVGLNLLELK